MLAVVENDFEQPIGAQRQVIAGTPRAAVAVFYALDVALRELAGDYAISFLWGCLPDTVAVRRHVSSDVGIVFLLVPIQDGIASVIVAFANQPGEDTGGIGG